MATQDRPRLVEAGLGLLFIGFAVAYLWRDAAGTLAHSAITSLMAGLGASMVGIGLRWR